MALFSYGHDGVHGILLREPAVNNFISRYFLLFPCFISLSRYRIIHMLHHKFLGAPLDPDLKLYQSEQVGFFIYMRQIFLLLISGRMSWHFLSYFTCLPQLLPPYRKNAGIKSLIARTDILSFILFHLSVLTICWLTGYLGTWFLFWFLPAQLSHPYYLHFARIQHGKVWSAEEPIQRSRSVRGNLLVETLFLPGASGAHAAHHFDPRVPNYHLKRFSKYLENESAPLRSEDFFSAMRDSF